MEAQCCDSFLLWTLYLGLFFFWLCVNWIQNLGMASSGKMLGMFLWQSWGPHRSLHHKNCHILFFFFYDLFICLFEEEEEGQRGRETENPQAGSTFIMLPDIGLDVTTLRSQSELKSSLLLNGLSHPGALRTAIFYLFTYPCICSSIFYLSSVVIVDRVEILVLWFYTNTLFLLNHTVLQPHICSFPP